MRDHTCKLPSRGRYQIGTYLTCDYCGRAWYLLNTNEWSSEYSRMGIKLPKPSRTASPPPPSPAW